ncbi:MAG: murein biosynthesis integral membrane protein MurJ [Victivallaceae bacterium]
MKESSRKILKSSSAVAAATLFSRILGLFRVIMEASVLGGGALASAWQLAFMVPNMFRRFLGEGALGTAMVPLVSHALEKEGSVQTRRQLGAIFLVLSVVLALLIIIVSCIALLLLELVTVDYGRMALQLIPLLMPYAFFMCFVGVISSVLNSVKVFFLPALGALLLNISIISCLLFIVPGMGGDFNSALKALSYAVLLAGAVQLVLMLALLWRHKMLPLKTQSFEEGLKTVKELTRLTIPGLIGASALQFSLLTDRLIAAFIGPYAVPALTYCDRIIYLPISIFALSLGVVLLPDMSRAAAKDDFEELFSHLRLALRCLLYLCVPIAVFTVLFREPVLRLLYMRGAFTETSLRETAWAMLFYGCGIPFFAITKILVQAFYARKDMTTPLKISVFCIFINLILSLSLMIWLRQGGIALATVIASLLNNFLLLRALHKKFAASDMKLKTLLPDFFTGGIVSAVLSVALLCVYSFLYSGLKISWLPQDLLPLTLSGGAFCVLYFILTFICGSQTPKMLLGLFRRNSR